MYAGPLGGGRSSASLDDGRSVVSDRLRSNPTLFWKWHHLSGARVSLLRANNCRCRMGPQRSGGRGTISQGLHQSARQAGGPESVRARQNELSVRVDPSYGVVCRAVSWPSLAGPVGCDEGADGHECACQPPDQRGQEGGVAAVEPTCARSTMTAAGSTLVLGGPIPRLGERLPGVVDTIRLETDDDLDA